MSGPPVTVASFVLGDYEFEIKETGLGHLCGYMTVPKGHPWEGLGYDDVHEQYVVQVHGGLTYVDDRTFGFDCGHYGDAPRADHPMALKLGRAIGDRNGVYRDQVYVTRELLDLWHAATNLERKDGA